MKNKKIIGKRLAVVLVSAVTLFAGGLVQPAEVQAKKNAWPKGPEINAPNAVVMEVNTGTVLYKKKEHERHYPASITKILTTLLTIENCDMNEIITFSADAVYKNEGDTSNIARDLNEEMTVEQTLYGVMLESANECAYAAAEHVGQKLGGDYQTFIDLMNKKAKELGCTDTHFNNSNGLPDEEHWTSAYDMALISCEAYRNEQFRTITGTPNYQIPPTNKHSDVTYLNNHHNILHFFNTGKYINEYCTGGKTGYTRVANSTLVTYAEKDGLVLCVVIMNANSPDHWTDTNKLIDYCFSNYQALNISEHEASIAESNRLSKGILNTYGDFVTLDEEAYIVLPNTAEFKDANFERDDEVDDKNTIAALKYTYGGREVGNVEIVAANATVEDLYYSQAGTEGAEGKDNVITIKPVVLIVGGISAAFLLTMLLVIKYVYDNFYFIRHNREVKRAERERFKTVRVRKRRRGWKNRLFK